MIETSYEEHEAYVSLLRRAKDQDYLILRLKRELHRLNKTVYGLKKSNKKLRNEVLLWKPHRKAPEGFDCGCVTFRNLQFMALYNCLKCNGTGRKAVRHHL